MVIVSILLGAIVVQHFAIVNPSAARKAAFKHIVITLLKCSCRKGLGSSSSVLEGWTSSTICNNSVTIEQIAIAIDVIGRTNVIIQVEVRIAPINQHGVHDTTKKFKSNINM